jgi:MacB-like periplasmic core domain
VGSTFHRDPNVLGRTVLVNGAPFEIIGVTAAGFRGLAVGGPDLWAPLSQLGQFRPVDRGREDRAGVEIVGRLRSGVSKGQARAQLAAWNSNQTASTAATIDLITISDRRWADVAVRQIARVTRPTTEPRRRFDPLRRRESWDHWRRSTQRSQIPRTQRPTRVRFSSNIASRSDSRSNVLYVVDQSVPFGLKKVPAFGIEFRGARERELASIRNNALSKTGWRRITDERG